MTSRLKASSPPSTSAVLSTNKPLVMGILVEGICGGNLIYMIITLNTAKHNWNYFLAIEKDLANLAQYIEFEESNLGTFWIELAHILLSASSEVDVIMKQLCSFLSNNTPLENINQYKKIISEKMPELIEEKVFINRYWLTFTPWENWKNWTNPDWWSSYNNVKHHRNDCFKEANLQNTINSVGALLISVAYYYKVAFSVEKWVDVNFKETFHNLEPESTFLKLSDQYYYSNLVV